MRICFNVSAMNKGGAERVVSSLANYFSCNGIEVYINLIAASTKTSAYKLDEKIHLISSIDDGKKPRFFKRVKVIRNVIEKIKPDIVIAFLPQVCVYSYFALRNTEIPLIVSERNDPNQYSLILKVLLKLVFKKAQGRVYQTHDACSWYKKERNKFDAIIFNPVFYSDSFFTKFSNSFSKISKKILAVGRLDKQKNYIYMLKAFSFFVKKHKDYTLHIYGKGPDYYKIKKIIKKLRLDDNVILEGVSDSWIEDNKQSSLFISTSKFEGMPNSLEEAACANFNCLSLNYPIGGAEELSNLLPNIKIVPYSTKPYVFADFMDKLLLEKVEISKIPDALKIEHVAQQWLEFAGVCLNEKKVFSNRK